MGVNRWAFLKLATEKASEQGTTVRAVVRSIALNQFTTSITNGRTLVRTSEAGGSVEFEFPSGLGPAQIVALAADALEWIDSRPDPDNPGLPRRIKRLRATFNLARL